MQPTSCLDQKFYDSPDDLCDLLYPYLFAHRGEISVPETFWTE